MNRPPSRSRPSPSLSDHPDPAEPLTPAGPTYTTSRDSNRSTVRHVSRSPNGRPLHQRRLVPATGRGTASRAHDFGAFASTSSPVLATPPRQLNRPSRPGPPPAAPGEVGSSPPGWLASERPPPWRPGGAGYAVCHVGRRDTRRVRRHPTWADTRRHTRSLRCDPVRAHKVRRHQSCRTMCPVKDTRDQKGR